MSASTDYYESTGTIHLTIEDEKTKNIFFVPDKDHCVKHRGKEYAVFLSKGSCKDAKVKRFEEGLNSARLILDICNCKMNTAFTALLNAATKGSTVDVKVKCKEDGEKLKLIGITVPALPVK